MTFDEAFQEVSKALDDPPLSSGDESLALVPVAALSLILREAISARDLERVSGKERISLRPLKPPPANWRVTRFGGGFVLQKNFGSRFFKRWKSISWHHSLIDANLAAWGKARDGEVVA